MRCAEACAWEESRGSVSRCHSRTGNTVDIRRVSRKARGQAGARVLTRHFNLAPARRPSLRRFAASTRAMVAVLAVVVLAAAAAATAAATPERARNCTVAPAGTFQRTLAWDGLNRYGPQPSIASSFSSSGPLTRRVGRTAAQDVHRARAGEPHAAAAAGGDALPRPGRDGIGVLCADRRCDRTSSGRRGGRRRGRWRRRGGQGRDERLTGQTGVLACVDGEVDADRCRGRVHRCPGRRLGKLLERRRLLRASTGGRR